LIIALRQILLDRSVHPVHYILRAWPMAMVPTLVIATTASIIAQLLGAEYLFDENQWGELFEMSSGMLLLRIVVVAPVFETLLMAPLLALLVRVLPRRRYAVIASAAVWALLHSLSAPIWGVCIFWTFIVFSTAFLVWREVSLWRALAVTAAIHALNNALAGLGIALS
jgi:membrane protease YdiL (CAAX protease family)